MDETDADRVIGDAEHVLWIASQAPEGTHYEPEFGCYQTDDGDLRYDIGMILQDCCGIMPRDSPSAIANGCAGLPIVSNDDALRLADLILQRIARQR